MPKTEIGARVGAILKADSIRVHLFGYGKYAGEEVPPSYAGGFNLGLPNPKIVLDDGRVVFGCECWWGGEKSMKKAIGNRMVVWVDINKHREEAAGIESTRKELESVLKHKRE